VLSEGFRFRSNPLFLLLVYRAETLAVRKGSSLRCSILQWLRIRFKLRGRRGGGLGILWEDSLKKACLLACLFFFVSAAFAQSGDIAFGVSGLTSPSPSSFDINSGNFFAPTMGGGTYLNVTGDFLLRHNLGVEGEIAWRAHQNLYQGYQPYRPLFYDFGAVWAPRFGRVGAELSAGIGAESLRFYNNFYTCSFAGCTNYTSSNHFMGAFGGGLKFYVTHNIFVRPEARLYLIHDNFEFAGSHAIRAGVSIGYSFGGD
jgi:opacity protein-like surface antigen